MAAEVGSMPTDSQLKVERKKSKKTKDHENATLGAASSTATETKSDTKKSGKKRKRDHDIGTEVQDGSTVDITEEKGKRKHKDKKSKRASNSEEEVAEEEENGKERKKSRRKAKDLEAGDVENISMDIDEDVVKEGDKVEGMKRKKYKKNRVAADVSEDEVSKETEEGPLGVGGEENKHKKRKKDASQPKIAKDVDIEPPPKERKNKTGFLDPEKDASLSGQSRKALSYAFSQFHRPSKWKFNKARQNWLIRNIWSIEAIPDAHFSLLVKYLSQVQGGVRENLVKSCRSALEAPKNEPEPIEAAPEATGGILVPSVEKVESEAEKIKQGRGTILLEALTETSSA